MLFCMGVSYSVRNKEGRISVFGSERSIGRRVKDMTSGVCVVNQRSCKFLFRSWAYQGFLP